VLLSLQARPAAENLAGLAAGAVVVVRPTPPDANGEEIFVEQEPGLELVRN